MFKEAFETTAVDSSTIDETIRRIYEEETS